MTFSRSRRALFAGLLLLAGPAAAQGPPPTTALAVAIDPQVTALFKQTIAAHEALPTMTATIAATSSARGLAGNTEQTIMLAYQQPRQARAIITDKNGPIAEFVTDGTTVTSYSAHDKSYRTDPVPATFDISRSIFYSCRSLLAGLIGWPYPLSEILKQPGVTASIGMPSRVGTTPTDTVDATLPNPIGKVNLTIEIGRSDHLLRRITETQTFTASDGKTNTEKHTETVTALSVTPALTTADFVFTPPPGVTKAKPPKAARAEPPMHDPRLVPGAKPFPVAAKDLSGKPLSLAQYKGKVVLLDFWATWCGPCVGEMPNVRAAYKKYHAQGFEIVGVSLDESRPALTRFIADNKMPWRQVFDGKGWNSAVPREYGVSSIPFGLLIGRDGTITAVDVRGPALATAVQQALAQKAASK